MSAKISPAEWVRINRIKKGNDIMNDIDCDVPFLLSIIDRFRPKSKQRLVYKMERCEYCDGSGNGLVDIDRAGRCGQCKGLGQVRTRVNAGNL